MRLRTGYLGLGSNVGDREAHIEAAIDLLGGDPGGSAVPEGGVDEPPGGVEGSRGGVIVEAVSSLYETEPVGEVLDQRDFVNAACRIRTSLEPEALLDLCKQVEAERGRRERGVRHGPRPLDVDLLLLGDLEYEGERLRLPHPEVITRRFVLEPLLELDPGLQLPDGTRLADCLAALPEGQRVARLA